MNKAPSYPWYPQDVISSIDCQLMTLEQYGAYHRLLEFSWIESRQCYLRNDPEKLAQLLRVSREKFDELWQTLSSKFCIDGDYIFNQRLLVERRKQRKRYMQTVKNGRLGGRPRKNRAKPEWFTKQNQRGLQNKTQEKPLSSSSSSSRNTLPTPTPSADPPDPDPETGRRWAEILAQVQNRVGTKECATWFEPLEVIELNGTVVRVRAPNETFAAWFREAKISALREVTGLEPIVEAPT